MQQPLFHEEQRIRQWWIWLVVLFIALLSWAGFIQQIVRGEEFGTNPAPDWLLWLFLVLFGILLPLAAWKIRMETDIDQNGMTIQFRPFLARRFPAKSIEGFQQRTYHPIREYGGWGVRGLGSVRAYNVSGDEGVELSLTDGKRVMIGSRRATELAAALATLTDSRG